MARDSDIVTLQNIDDEDFMFEYNASEGNAPYVIAAGEVARFPRFLAEHALKHLIDKVLNKQEESTGNQTLRLELANQIVVGEEAVHQVAEPTEGERLRNKIDELNKPTTLETILAKRKEEKSYKKKVPAADEADVNVDEKFEGLEPVEPEPTKTEEPAPEPKPIKTKDVKPKPTRAEIYKYAEAEMNMVIDPDTKKNFDKLKVDDLIEELQYPTGK